MTKEYFETLVPCSVYGYDGTWNDNYRFVRRGKKWVTVAVLTAAGHIYTTRRTFGCVAVNGRRLAYSSRKPNPRKPEPFDDRPLETSK